jgi:hypothetical protein
MATTEPSASEQSTPATPRGGPYFAAGALVAVLGIAIYIGQVFLGQFTIPWYMPVLATLGVALMAFGVYQRRGVGRMVGLAFFVLLAAFEWFFMTRIAPLPAYAGPAVPGRKLPAFAATLADGRPFTEKNLEGGGPSVLVFFRGRW